MMSKMIGFSEFVINFQVIRLDTIEPWSLFFQDSTTSPIEGLDLHSNISCYLVIILFLVIWTILCIIVDYIKNFFPNKYIHHFTLFDLAWKIREVIPLIWIAFTILRLFYYLPCFIDDTLIMFSDKMSFGFILNSDTGGSQTDTSPVAPAGGGGSTGSGGNSPTQSGPSGLTEPANNSEQNVSNVLAEPTNSQLHPRTGSHPQDLKVTYDVNRATSVGSLKVSYNKSSWSPIFHDPISSTIRQELSLVDNFKCIITHTRKQIHTFEFPSSTQQLLNHIEIKTQNIKNSEDACDNSVILRRLNRIIELRNTKPVGSISALRNFESEWKRENPAEFCVVENTRELRVLEGIRKISDRGFASQIPTKFFED